MNKKIRKRSRGLSTIVTTVMLVVISIIGVSVIAGFLIPMVREAPEKGADCFTAREHLSIVGQLGNIKSCWNASSYETVVIVKRNNDDIDINGFAVSLAKEGESKRFDIISGIDNPDATTISYKSGAAPYYGTTNQPERIVSIGSEYTYYFNTGASMGRIVQAEIAPILESGDVCSATETLEIVDC